MTAVILVPSGTAHAKSIEEDIEKEINEEVEKGLNDLVTSDIENFFAALENAAKYNFGTTFKEVVKRIINGDPIDSKIFFNLISGAIKENIATIIASLVSIITLSILYGMAKNLSSGFVKESTSQVIYYAVYGAIIATLCYIVNGAIISAKAVISSVSGLVQVVFPVLLTLVTALGGAASAAAYQPIILIFTNVVVRVIELVIMPMFYATIVFSIIGNLTTNIKLEKLTSAIKSTANWTLGIMFGLIITLLSAQGIVGASIDTVGVKSAKFALSSYVPILGGYLSDGFDIVMASAVLLKNATGLAAVIILFLVILAPVIKIAVLTLMLRLTAGIIEPIADSRISNLLYSVSKNLSILISIVLGMAFLVFGLLMLIIYTFNPGVA
ncbi:MAG: stage III sporulation protein AE [Clostridia bacterium]